MDDLAVLIRGIGRIALAMRERADTLGFANASHLHAIADSLDGEVEAACPQRRQWRNAPIAPQSGRALLAAAQPTLGEVLAGTYRGIPVFVKGPGRDVRDPIRAVFRQCGMFDAAANDQLRLDLYQAVANRTVVVPIVDQKVLDEASEMALRTGFAMTDGVRVLSREDVAPPCTCPSGDGSLRWPCPAHPPAAVPAGVVELMHTALAAVHAFARPENWSDPEDPEQAEAWTLVDAALLAANAAPPAAVDADVQRDADRYRNAVRLGLIYNETDKAEVDAEIDALLAAALAGKREGGVMGIRQHDLLLIGGPHDGEVKALTISGPTFRTIYQREPGYSLDPTPVYAEYAIAKLAIDGRLVGIFVDLVFRVGKRAERAEVSGE